MAPAVSHRITLNGPEVRDERPPHTIEYSVFFSPSHPAHLANQGINSSWIG